MQSLLHCDWGISHHLMLVGSAKAVMETTKNFLLRLQNCPLKHCVMSVNYNTTDIQKFL